MDKSIHLAHEFTYRTSVVGPHEVGTGPCGTRQCYEMIDGAVEGERLSGRTIGAGADWMLAASDGFLRMDVRIQFKTYDDAVICARYHGPAEANARLLDAIAEFDDQLIRTHWLLEAGDPRYAWVNKAVFVGEGRFNPQKPGVAGFEHRVYRVC